MLRTEAEVKGLLSLIESKMTGDEDTEDPSEVIRETLLWVLCHRTYNAVLDFLPER